MTGKLFAPLFALISLFVSAVDAAETTKPIAAPVEIVSAEFGVFDVTNPKEPLFTPTRIVPHQESQRYGWVIEVRTNRRSLSVREEYLLPGKRTGEVRKDLDDVSESLVIDTPRHNQISQRQLVPVDGKIYGEWAIGSNEPAGHRQLQVVIENEVAASFVFDVK